MTPPGCSVVATTLEYCHYYKKYNLRRKCTYLVAYLPPGNCWNGFMFPWLMFIFICTVHGSEVLFSVDSAPPDRGLVHVLIIRHPHVKLVGVIELAAKGDLSLQKNICIFTVLAPSGAQGDTVQCMPLSVSML